MTVDKLMQWAESIAHDEDGFWHIVQEIEEDKLTICTALESDPDNRELKKKYKDDCEKLRMIQLMRQQRLELYRQSGF